jgi:hypothetical protein
MNIPDKFQFDSTELVEVSHLESTFNIDHKTALLYLKALRINPVYIGQKAFFSISALNRIMYVISRPGSPGFLFPCSKGKQNQRLKEQGYLTEITDEMLEAASSPTVMAEMAAASGSDPSMVKKLLANENAKSRKSLNEKIT